MDEPTQDQRAEGPVRDPATQQIDANPAKEPDASEFTGAEEAGTSTSTPGHHSFWNRLLGTLRCEPGVFEEIAADPGATRQALAVVAIQLLAVMIGGATTIDWDSWQAVPTLLLFPVSGFASWPISAAICSVGARLFSADSPRFPCWLRAVGFVQAPLALGVFPIVGAVAGWFYCLALQVAAVKRLAGVSTGIAIVVGLLAVLGPGLFGFLVFAFAISFMGLVQGGLNMAF